MSLILIYVVVIGAAFMFMTTRGRKKQAAQAQAMQQALVQGAEVRTIGGLVGTVAEMTDEYVVIETTPGVKLKFTKQAIAGVVQPADPETPVYGEELTPEEAAAYPYSDLERAFIEDRQSTQHIGSPDTVIAGLEDLVKQTGVEELMLTTQTHDPADRLHSFELVAAAARAR